MNHTNNFMIAVLLAVVLFAAVVMGCCQTTEAFQDATPMKKSIEDAITSEVEKKAEEDQKKETEKDVADIKKALEEPTPEEKPAAAPMNKQEQELFEQITKNSLSNTDLKKLISAGILTENMVEKFLNKLSNPEEKEEKIEGFCSGNSCYASII